MKPQSARARRREAIPAASEPTADGGRAGETPIAVPDLVHGGRTPPTESAPDFDFESTVPGQGPQRSGSAVLWWSLGGIGVVAVLGAVILFPRPHPAKALSDSPSPMVQPTPLSQPEPAQTQPPVQAQSPGSGSATPQKSDGKDTHHTAPVPSHHETAKKAADAKQVAEPKRVAEYDGWTEKDIPGLIRMAESDAGHGNYEKARREFNVDLRLDPDNAEAKQGLRKLNLSEQETH